MHVVIRFEFLRKQLLILKLASVLWRLALSKQCPSLFTRENNHVLSVKKLYLQFVS